MLTRVQRSILILLLALCAAVCPAQAEDAVLSISNTSAANIQVVVIEANEDQRVVAEIAAGATNDVSLPDGTVVGFDQGGTWLGEGHTVAGSEAISVPITYQEAVAPPVVDPALPAVTVANTTGDTITIFSIAADGTPTQLLNVAPGESIRQPAATGSTLAFAAAADWVGNDYLVAGTADESVSVPYLKVSAEQLRQAGPGSVDISFTNSTAEKIFVATVDGDKYRVELFDVAAGEVFKGRALPQTPLWFFKADGAVVGDAYVVGEADNNVTLPHVSLSAMQQKQMGPGSIAVEFANTGTDALVVATIDDEKYRADLFELAAGETVKKPVQPATPLWFYKKGGSETVGEPYMVTEKSDKVTLPYSSLPAAVAAQTGPGSVEVTVANDFAIELVVATSDDQGNRVDLFDIPATVGPHKFRALPKSVLWFFNKEDGNQWGDGYLVTGENDSVTLPFKYVHPIALKQQGPGSVSTMIRNFTEPKVDITVATVDENGARFDLRDIPGGRPSFYNYFPGTRLFFYRKGTNELMGESYEVKNEADQSWTVPYAPKSALQIKHEGTGTQNVGCTNTLDAPVDVFTLEDGKPGKLIRVPAREHVQVAALKDSPLYFYKVNEVSGTYEPVGDAYFVSDDNVQNISVPYTQSATDLVKAANIDINAIAAQLTASLVQAQLANAGPSICWKDTTTRGVGSIPRNCPAGQEEQLGFCYDKCQPGYYGSLTSCVAECPAGWVNLEWTCVKPAPYVRDEYPVNFGEALDTVGSWFGGSGGGLAGAKARCKAAHGDNCVTANEDTIVYESCKAGYSQAPVITNLCSPDCPAGFTDIGVSCGKPIYDRGIGDLMSCSGGQQRDAGLCYDNCPSGYTGVGPVCWASCPAKLPTNCGASCGTTTAECAMSIVDQTTGPLMTAANVALIVVTAGGATAATPGLTAAKTGAVAGGKTAGQMISKNIATAAGRAALKASVKQALVTGARSATVAALKAGGKAVAKDMLIDTAVSAVISGAFTVGFSEKAKADLRSQLTTQIDQQLGSKISDEQIETIVNTAIAGAEAQGASTGVPFPLESLDPTGVADIVRAFNNPLCSSIQQE